MDKNLQNQNLGSLLGQNNRKQIESTSYVLSYQQLNSYNGVFGNTGAYGLGVVRQVNENQSNDTSIEDFDPESVIE